MAKINAGSFRDWNDGETVKARDYKQEREIMRTAINNTYDRFLEEEAELQQLELDLREQGDYALAQGDYAKGQGNAVQEALEKSVNLINSPTKPEGIVAGRLWLDPSDNTYQGTVFEELNTQLAQTEKLVNVIEQFGAKGDNVQDDTLAIKTAIAYAETLKRKLFFPKVSVGYKTTETIAILEAIDVIMESPIIYHGISDKTVLRYGSETKVITKVFLKLQAQRFIDWTLGNDVDWSNENSVAVQVVNVAQSYIEVVEGSNCTIGFQVLASSDKYIAYNQIYVHALINNKYGIDLLIKTGNNFITESFFFGGRISHFSTVNTTQSRYGIRTTRLSTVEGFLFDGLSFYNQCFEMRSDVLTGGAEAIPFVLNDVNTCEFINFRLEKNDPTVMARLARCWKVNFHPLKVSSNGLKIQENEKPIRSGYSEVNTNKNQYVYSETPIHRNTNITNSLYTVPTSFATRRVNLINLIGVSFSSGVFDKNNHLRRFMQFTTTDSPVTSEGLKWNSNFDLQNLGIGIDTSNQKVFKVNKGISRMALLCFDTNGDYIVPLADSNLVQGSYLKYSSARFGGYYIQDDTGVTQYEELYFEVANSVKKIIIVFGNSTVASGKVFKGFEVHAVYNGEFSNLATPPTVWHPLGIDTARHPHCSSVPTLDTHILGKVFYNNNPVAGGYSGWICTLAGTPGTWKGVGLIEA